MTRNGVGDGAGWEGRGESGGGSESVSHVLSAFWPPSGP